MAEAITTEFRSYSTISLAVRKCRELGALAESIEFSITDFIFGPLKDYFRGRLRIDICGEGAISDPANVEVSNDRRSIVLHVKHHVWRAAAEGDPESRYILAHEIGHIWLHRDDVFGFTDATEVEHKFIPAEKLVEDQAHRFAEIFLLPDGFVSGFDRLEDIIDYCDFYGSIPLHAIRKRFFIIDDKKRYNFRPRYEPGCLCKNCGSERVFSLMDYRKCDDCNNITY